MLPQLIERINNVSDQMQALTREVEELANLVVGASDKGAVFSKTGVVNQQAPVNLNAAVALLDESIANLRYQMNRLDDREAPASRLGRG